MLLFLAGLRQVQWLILCSLAFFLTACPDSSSITPTSLGVTIASPTIKTYTRGPATVHLTITGTPDAVRLLRNDQPFITVISPYEITFETGAWPEAPYAIKGRVVRGSEVVTSNPITLVVDRTAPVVTNRTPNQNQDGVAFNTSVTINFSEALQPESLTSQHIQVKRKFDNLPVPGNISTTPSGIVFSPQGLDRATQYQIELNGFQDLAGNPLVSTNWSFATSE